MTLRPPKGSLYGDDTWTNSFSGTVACSDVDATQSFTGTITNTLYAYYADAPIGDDAYPYYFIHRMVVQASAGTLFSDTTTVRGFITSSFRAGYRALHLNKADADSINITCIHQSPTASGETIETSVDGKTIPLTADKGGGSTGEIEFEPTYRKTQQIPAWQLEISAGGSLPAWEVYQAKPWSGRGVTDAGGTNAKRDLLDEVFNRSPSGDIVQMPPMSRGTISCEFLTMWLVDERPMDDRKAWLTIAPGFEQRLTLFHNAKAKDKSAHRHTSIFTPTITMVPDRVIALHELTRIRK